jgi:hypothetical protein
LFWKFPASSIFCINYVWVGNVNLVTAPVRTEKRRARVKKCSLKSDMMRISVPIPSSTHQTEDLDKYQESHPFVAERETLKCTETEQSSSDIHPGKSTSDGGDDVPILAT